MKSRDKVFNSGGLDKESMSILCESAQENLRAIRKEENEIKKALLHCVQRKNQLMKKIQSRSM